MMSMEMKDLETFLLIVKTGSFTETARLMHVTQPGVSRRIRQLEEELECRLFEKVGNGLIITEDGQYLIPHAEGVIQAARSLKRAFEMKKGKFQAVTIAFSSSLAGTPYTARFKELKGAFRNVQEFRLRMLNEADLSQSVLKGETDIGVRYFRDQSSKLTYHQVAEDPFVLVRAAESQWFAEGSEVTMESLGRVPWLTLTETDKDLDPLDVVIRLTNSVCERLGIYREQKIECYGWGVTKSMVDADLGIAFLPWMKVADDVQRGRLTVVELPEQPALPLYGIYRKNAVHGEQLKEILEFVATGKYTCCGEVGGVVF
jgi:DNA-binding transcriptional LysR family regulator